MLCTGLGAGIAFADDAESGRTKEGVLAVLRAKFRSFLLTMVFFVRKPILLKKRPKQKGMEVAHCW